MGFKIKIICFGTKRDSFAGEVDRYVKMLRAFAPVNIEYLKPLSANGLTVEKQLSKESVLIMKKIDSSSYLVTLAEEGKLFNGSHLFAKWLNEVRERVSSLTFVIGSAYGLSSDVKQKSDVSISLSPLTMPYSLCIVTLTEQIYRAYTILCNHPYHK